MTTSTWLPTGDAPPGWPAEDGQVSDADELMKPRPLFRPYIATVVTQLKARVNRLGNLLAALIVPRERAGGVVGLEPAADFGPAPQSVAGAWVGYGSRKPSRAAFVRDQQANAFSAPTRVRGDIGHGDKTATSQPNHLDAREAFDIGNCRQDSSLRIRPVPVEIEVLYPVGTTHQRIIAARIEKGVDSPVAL